MGLRRNSSSVGAATAFWLGNTALNPAVLIFMTFVLSWKFTLLRIVLGIILVFGVSHVANRFSNENTDDVAKILNQLDIELEETHRNLLIRWLKSVGKLLIGILPVYIFSVLVLGAVRAWLFPAIPIEWANSIPVMLFFAISGTLFVIPTAGEVPIVQTLMSFGLGYGPAAALMFSLPVISLPSMLMVRRVFPRRVLVFLAVSVAILAFIGALVASTTF